MSDTQRWAGHATSRITSSVELQRRIDELESELSTIRARTVEECALVSENYKRPIEPRPTVEQLEKILNSPERGGFSIEADGSIVPTGTESGRLIAEAIRALMTDRRL